MENQLVVGVKSEKPEAEPTVNNTKFENMDIWTLNEEFDIKNECEMLVQNKDKAGKRNNEIHRSKKENSRSSAIFVTIASHCKKGLIGHIKRKQLLFTI
ncbi:unnamed protein product [Acanthoscelides obtectus]|uniref:Uncharacterized protein n=1 Tax=Acanthoscelides obtectus TaxID=200917 RepID=A0A9P0QGL8_ACAOB|nr:unnamed protein product [Acanthoscelides obtectus]CAK1682406.1 hypothetical protein AOBTE_LOCUS33607 [Acanthoscelides obtectus]